MFRPLYPTEHNGVDRFVRFELATIDVGFAVHPYVEWIVTRSIRHDDQMTSGHSI